MPLGYCGASKDMLQSGNTNKPNRSAEPIIIVILAVFIIYFFNKKGASIEYTRPKIE
jgi:hypothetical protein